MVATSILRYDQNMRLYPTLINSKIIEKCESQHANVHKFSKKDLKIVFRPHIFVNFFDKSFSFVILHKLGKFH